MKNNQPLIDIVIVNYNSTDQLLNCLETLFNILRDIPAKVHIQDNGSKDNPDRIKKLFPTAFVTYNRKNLGFSAAINRVIEQSSAPYTLLLNPDTIIYEDFLEPLIEYMEDNPDVGGVGPKILNLDGSVQGSARRFPTPLTGLFGRTTMLSRLFPNNPFTRGSIVTFDSDGISPMQVDWISGACMLIRRRTIEEIGLMDERFFLYWEDADWCRRIWEKNWRVVYFPKSKITHYTGKSSETHHIRSRFEFHRSGYHLFAKYTNWPLAKPFAAFILAFRFCIVSISYILRKPIDAIMKFRHVPVESSASPEKIKVIRIISRLNIGGPAIHAQVLTKGFNNEKFESILISGKVSPYEGDMSHIFNPNNSNIIHLSELGREIHFRNDFKALIKIFRILLREQPHIVQTHTAKAGFIGRLAVSLYNLTHPKKIVCVHTFHGHVFEGYFKKSITHFFIVVERIMAKFTNFIVAISDSQEKDLVENFRIAPANKVKTIALGFNLKPFLNGKHSKGTFRKKFDISEDTILVGIVGRLAPIKNHKVFLEVAKAFSQKKLYRHVTFVIVGDGELKTMLESLCNQQGLNGQVIFCGWENNIHTVYADLDILALTSLNEGTPVSIIEAMASSVPVIATDVGGVVDLLGNPTGKKMTDNGFKICERGILCQKNDVSGFSEGLEWLIENDNAPEIETLVDRAKSFVSERYSYERLIKEIGELYTDVVR